MVGGGTASIGDELALMWRTLSRETHVLAADPEGFTAHLRNRLYLDEDEESPLPPDWSMPGTLSSRTAHGCGCATGRRRGPASGLCEASSSTPDEAVLVAWSPDETRLATGTLRGTSIWEAATGRLEVAIELGIIGGLAWSPDGLRLATHPDHRTVTLRGWHRVLLNTESEARARESVAFLD